MSRKMNQNHQPDIKGKIQLKPLSKPAQAGPGHFQTDYTNFANPRLYTSLSLAATHEVTQVRQVCTDPAAPAAALYKSRVSIRAASLQLYVASYSVSLGRHVAPHADVCVTCRTSLAVLVAALLFRR